MSVRRFNEPTRYREPTDELSQRVRRFFDVGEFQILTFNYIYIYMKAKVGRRRIEARTAWKINTGASNLRYVRDTLCKWGLGDTHRCVTCPPESTYYALP